MMILVCWRDPIPLNMINLYKILDLDLIREEILEYNSHSVINIVIDSKSSRLYSYVFYIIVSYDEKDKQIINTPYG